MTTPRPSQLRCRHCGLPIVEWHSPEAQRFYRRPHVWVHTDLCDIASDGVHCRTSLNLTTPTGDPQHAEPSTVTKLAIALLATPGPMGQRGSMSLHIAARCRNCNGEGVVVADTLAPTRDDLGGTREVTCPRCEGVKVAVYVQGEQEFDAAVDDQLAAMTTRERAEAEEWLTAMRRSASASYRVALAAAPFRCGKCNHAQDVSTGSCVVCGGVLEPRPSVTVTHV